MHGAWGALTNLTKRQHNEKVRKAELRHKLQKRKESYITDKVSQNEFDFPELSRLEMNKIKKEIRKKMRTQKLYDAFWYLTRALLIGALLAAILLFS